MLVALLDIERAVASSLGRRFSCIQLATCRWQGQSETAVAVEGVKTEVETLPPEAERRSYFLEVSVAREAFSAQTLCSVSALPRGVPGPGGGSSGARVVRAVRAVPAARRGAKAAGASTPKWTNTSVVRGRSCKA